MAKYIVIDEDNGAGEIMIVFPNNILHSDMVERLKVEKRHIVSAGVAVVDEDVGLSCYGESTTLMRQSRRKIDTALLRLTLT
jgi:hypothetical protein